jgi:prolyl-tRNA editing enzyme YbaK/EbsC (Cys-tRNA(Pro) deacylase)
VRAATAAETNAATGYPSGLVSPVALGPEVEVLADTALGATDVVYTAAGEGGLALGIRTRDLLVAVGARAASLTPLPLPVPRPRFADIVDLDRSELADDLETGRP